MQLHAFVDDAALHVRTPVFGRGRGRRRKLVLQYQLDAAIDIDLCDLPFGLHLGELEARVLVTRDRTAEDLPLLDVLARRLERVLATADCAARDLPALPGERLQIGRASCR